jgi:RNA-directed DNA polymerase
MGDQPGNREESSVTCKPYDIPKTLVWEAWLHVKANQGAAGIDSETAMRQTIRGWHLQLKSDKSLADLSATFDPVVRGWPQYYGRFYGSALKPVWRSMNLFLTRWLMRKHKTLTGHKTRASEMLKCLARRQPGAFARWSLGFIW